MTSKEFKNKINEKLKMGEIEEALTLLEVEAVQFGLPLKKIRSLKKQYLKAKKELIQNPGEVSAVSLDQAFSKTFKVIQTILDSDQLSQTLQTKNAKNRYSKNIFKAKTSYYYIITAILTSIILVVLFVPRLWYINNISNTTVTEDLSIEEVKSDFRKLADKGVKFSERKDLMNSLLESFDPTMTVTIKGINGTIIEDKKELKSFLEGLIFNEPEHYKIERILEKEIIIKLSSYTDLNG